MTKKNKKKKTKAAAIQFGGAMKDIAMAAATHPTIACIFVMAITRTAQMLNFEISPKKKDATGALLRPRQNFKNAGGVFRHKALQGLFNGASGIGTASALAPVVTGALGIAKEGIKAYRERPVEVELGYP